MQFIIRRFFVAASLVLIAVSCEVETTTLTETDSNIPEPPATTYTIKKGGHTGQSQFRLVDTTTIRFEATFDSSAIYNTAIPNNQADINKLYGLSDCDTDHHTNSARFGWRWYEGRLEIHAYTYSNKKRNTAYITSVQPGQANTYELALVEKGYIFKVNDTQVALPRSCNTASSHYQLYPYFGGDETAPHDITINIREL
ncbi:hypothetical protein K3G39_02250 [Pontibacter sp. HSC-14F20]|uniref:hypothetical protein n=1 Tax=Pontibacter sp. HSC-14F20 TaxID=2864136 RepID=UPI001C73B529|nr:hypothetical protein [Pontibacter sp. HSC-14F20]MBX0332050.1 hypothetical protein [Pontibacter sp. HSC-14F20]